MNDARLYEGFNGTRLQLAGLRSGANFLLSRVLFHLCLSTWIAFLGKPK